MSRRKKVDLSAFVSGSVATLGWKLTLSLVVLDLVLRIFVATRPYEVLDNLTLLDDTYLSLTIARSIGGGWGPLFGLGPTSGFQPLYAFLMAPVFTFGAQNPETPVRIALVLLALFDAAALYVLSRILLRWNVRRSLIIVAMLAWIVTPAVMLQTANGLETQIAVCLCLASVLVYSRLSKTTAKPGFLALSVLGLLLGLCALARIDTTFLALAVGTGVAIVLRRERVSVAPAIARLSALAGGFAVAYTPWLCYSYYQTGDLFPVSGRAVRYLALVGVQHQPNWTNAYWPAISAALNAIWGQCAGGVILLCITALFYLIARLVRGKPRISKKTESDETVYRATGAGVLAVFAGLLLAAYAGYILAVWYFDRYLFPVVVILIMLATLATDRCWSLLEKTSKGSDQYIVRIMLITVSAICLIGPSLVSSNLRYLLNVEQAPQRGGYRAIGEFVRDNVRPGSIVASAQTGAIAYFAPEVMAINLDGVVNADAYRAMKEKRLFDYLRDVGATHVIGWPRNIDLVRFETNGFDESEWEYLGHARGIVSWNYPWELYRVKY